MSNEIDLDRIASLVLKSCVYASLILIFVGTALIFIKGGSDGRSISQIANYHLNYGSKQIPLDGIPDGLYLMDGVYYIALGLWILIFTPITVVGIAFFSFIEEKNWLYVAMTIIVLFNLIFAMLVVPYLIGVPPA